MGVATLRRPQYRSRMPKRTRYEAPARFRTTTLKELVDSTGRARIAEDQMDLLRSRRQAGGKDDVPIYYAGDIELLHRPCVSVVGARSVSAEGKARASRLARELVEAGAVVVSGLAKGVDAAAMTTAIDAGGKTIGVTGTPLEKAYPAENAPLQEIVWQQHLLLTPFPAGERVFPSHFPKRNRVMAALTDATVIVEASDSSGTLHQAAECQRLGRWLFIMRSVAEDPHLKWPKSFLGQPKTGVLERTDQIMEAIK